MTSAPAPLRITPLALLRGHRRALRLAERNATLYRRAWLLIISGFFEPLFYLLSIGVGIGHLVGHIQVDGHPVRYTAYVAPALLAASAMNGAVIDSTFNVYHKLRYAKIYDAVLATPFGVFDVAIGEICWALLRGAMYATTFLVVAAALGLVHSWWALAALPTALLLSFGFAALGLAGTTFMRSWQDFGYVDLVTLPMFLFSATFFPLSTYPPALRLVVEITPLYQGVAVLRALLLGAPDAATVAHLAYLVVMGAVGLAVARRQLARILLH